MSAGKQRSLQKAARQAFSENWPQEHLQPWAVGSSLHSGPRRDANTARWQALFTVWQAGAHCRRPHAAGFHKELAAGALVALGCGA